jgi:hypothetical protein
VSLIDRGPGMTPVSDATNLYDLCEDACACMLQEHARYDQGVYGTTKDINPELFRDRRAPACGTIGCRAGWLVFLADGGFPHIADVTNIGGVISGRADELMGTSELVADDDDWERYMHDVEDLFSAGALFAETDHDMEDPDSEIPDVGTKEYAELGVRGMRAFMARWEARLRATPVARRAA